ncbi:GroES-like protein [Dothidotthia symphoricarpi CBS 119687]|uniref:GroES-like protein n=1 Tax=Dothidotthia symphoricarpi CBS 119687 TaxID=1392245 RepID=A0A6A6AQA1_9PLEO|nr:GroES-like protein [Dothidotthia symphoricarpi CBS 119687]KAF2133338.1 GroES-like protein [Dothidotthia symphoricarpi CBS 119687]
MAQTMKAWQYISVTGGMEKNLHINESAPKPVPGENEILVQVHVMALNPVDYKMTESPAPLRLLGSTFIPGFDFCGKVADIGKNVDGFTKGEYVFGGKIGSIGKGTLAQYVAVNKDQATSLPKGVQPEDAATVGIVGLTGYRAISPNVKSGDKVFINGGSGGTGVYAIQIAKALGCHVTTTCSTPNIELCKSIGADEVIDYKSTNVVKALSSKGPTFNLVVDNIGTPANLYKASSAFIAPGGTFAQVGMTPNLSGFLQVGSNVLRPGFLGGGKAKYQMVVEQGSKSNLKVLAEWMKEGKVKSVVDSVFEWEDAPKAYEKMKTGRTKGKIIIHVPQDNA